MVKIEYTEDMQYNDDLYGEYKENKEVVKMKTKSVIGKTIMARERGRSRNLGIVQSIDKETVRVYMSKNPEGYKHYELSRYEFDKWVESKLYTLR